MGGAVGNPDGASALFMGFDESLSSLSVNVKSDRPWTCPIKQVENARLSPTVTYPSTTWCLRSPPSGPASG